MGFTHYFDAWADAVYITFISDSPTEGYEFSGVANVSTTVFSMAHGDFGVEMVNGRAVLLFTAFDFTVGGSIWPPFLQVTPPHCQKRVPR